MKNLIKSRRGIAIELAIGVMFLMMAFTIMLMATAGLQNKHRNEDYDNFNEMIEINNVGEIVCKNFDTYKTTKNIVVKNTETNEDVDTGYDVEYTFANNENKYEIYRGEVDSGELVLTITLSSDGTTITSWK